VEKRRFEATFRWCRWEIILEHHSQFVEATFPNR
jgi:hypothetical protein